MKVDSDLLTYPFRDEHWQNKMLIGGALGLVGSFIWPLLLPLWGYGLRVMRRTIEDGQPALPEWDDWGRLFGDGLRYVVVALVYMLPALLVLCCALVAWLLVIPAAAMAERAPELLAASFAGQFLGFILMGLSFIPMLALSYLMIVAVTRLVGQGELRAAFDFRAVWQLARTGLRHYALALIVLFGATMVFMMVYYAFVYSLVLMCLAPLLVGAGSIYILAIYGALFGLAYREAQAELPPQLEPAVAE